MFVFDVRLPSTLSHLSMYAGTDISNPPSAALVDDSFSPPLLDRLGAGWPGQGLSAATTGFPAFPTSVYNRAWPRILGLALDRGSEAS